MINFTCLKWGTKYDSEYVNRLYTMIKRNCDVEFQLHCCTEDASNIREEVNIIPLPEHLYLETYWWKLWITSNEFPIKGKCVFFDLDIVIQNNLQELVDYECGGMLYILNAKWRSEYIKKIGKTIKLTSTNSSVMLWNSSVRVDAGLEKFIKDPEFYMTKYVGNDNYLEFELPGQYKTLPIEWVYCRVFGYDETDEDRFSYAVDIYDIGLGDMQLKLYRIPDRMICLFNGIDSEDIDYRIYDGFEHYWSDSMSDTISSHIH